MLSPKLIPLFRLYAQVHFAIFFLYRIGGKRPVALAGGVAAVLHIKSYVVHGAYYIALFVAKAAAQRYASMRTKIVNGVPTTTLLA